MAHFEASKGLSPETEPAAVSTRNARYGLVLFFMYLTAYAGFMLLNAFGARWMQHELAGVNVAVLYGFALIISALVLALLYVWLCRRTRQEAAE